MSKPCRFYALPFSPLLQTLDIVTPCRRYSDIFIAAARYQHIEDDAAVRLRRRAVYGIFSLAAQRRGQRQGRISSLKFYHRDVNKNALLACWRYDATFLPAAYTHFFFFLYNRPHSVIPNRRRAAARYAYLNSAYSFACFISLPLIISLLRRRRFLCSLLHLPVPLVRKLL